MNSKVRTPKMTKSVMKIPSIRILTNHQAESSGRSKFRHTPGRFLATHEFPGGFLAVSWRFPGGFLAQFLAQFLATQDFGPRL